MIRNRRRGQGHPLIARRKCDAPSRLRRRRYAARPDQALRRVLRRSTDLVLSFGQPSASGGCGMAKIEIELPEATAMAARDAGLLTSNAIERLLTDAIRRQRAADRLLSTADRVAAGSRADVNLRNQRGSEGRADRAPAACGRSLTPMCCCPACYGAGPQHMAFERSTHRWAHSFRSSPRQKDLDRGIHGGSRSPEISGDIGSIRSGHRSSARRDQAIGRTHRSAAILKSAPKTRLPCRK